MPVRLHINIDHIATLRNARGTRYPDPVVGAALAELAGADGITAHLREDRRHIRDDDVRRLRASVNGTFNLEMAATDEMCAIAEEVRPDVLTLVPEHRAERTTEGGLDVTTQKEAIEKVVAMAVRRGIRVSLFVEADVTVIEKCHKLGVQQIELHTGEYCHACSAPADHARRAAELVRLERAAGHARKLDLEVAAGHGLTVQSVGPVVAIGAIEEVNIGHAVIADALFSGLDRAVRDFRDAIDRARAGG